MRGFFRAVRFEVAKTCRMRLARGLVLILLMETVAKALMFHFNATEMAKAVSSGPVSDSASYMAVLMLTSLNALNLVALVFASLLIAGESSSGALRLTASLPVGRGAIASAKIVALLLFILLGVVLVSAINLGMTARFYGLHAVREIDYVVYSKGRIVGYYFLFHALAVPAILAIGCFGLLVSAWSSSSGGAVGVALLLYMGLSTFEKLQAPWLRLLKMRYSLQGTFSDMANGMIAGGLQWTELSEIGTNLCFAVGYFALFAGLAVASFALRDNYT